MNAQKGMTLVELVVASAITGIIVVFLGTAVYQTLTVTTYGNDRLTAAHELQNAAYWFNHDGMDAKAATGGASLKFTMSDNSTITYSLVGTELRRKTGSALEPTIIPTKITPVTPKELGAGLLLVALGNEMVLARNITSVSFSVNGRLVTMALTSSPPGKDMVTESGTYQVHLRPTES